MTPLLERNELPGDVLSKDRCTTYQYLATPGLLNR